MSATVSRGVTGALALLVGMLAGGGASAEVTSPRLHVTVAQYDALKERADEGDEPAGVLLGAYLAGLYAGITGTDAVHGARRLHCPPDGLDPELRDLLNFVDEALESLDPDARERDRLPLQRVLLEALVERFPCD